MTIINRTATVITILCFVSGCGVGFQNAAFPDPVVEGDESRSNLRVPAGATFELGGGQESEYTLQLVGFSGPALTVEVADTDAVLARAVLVSGDESVVEVPAGATAQLINLGRSAALVKVLFIQPVREQLGMRYAN